ncbi:DUF4307 domain-containing protein [Arthrobacter sp. KK5.5]|uniref:DUF4307 domain-containing protein n=1 Tax=Arthrobacter sp. KK5.5 TaxID=3373084 RepID=UPI003EE7C969
MNSHQSAAAGSPDNAPVSSLANRYGAPKRAIAPRQRNIAIIVALVLSVAAAGLLAVWNTQDITSKDIAFEINSPASATVVFDVDKNAADSVECSVRVLNESYAVVGWKTVVLEGGKGNGREKTRQVVDMRTESLGVTGGVGSCWER